jgi:hypothetical protein
VRHILEAWEDLTDGSPQPLERVASARRFKRSSTRAAEGAGAWFVMPS